MKRSETSVRARRRSSCGRCTPYSLLVGILTVCGGCERAKEPSPTETASESAAPKVEVVLEASWQPRYSVIGSVLFRRTITLRASHPGRVAGCSFEAGQAVKQGQLLLGLGGPKVDAPRRLLEDDLKILYEKQFKAQADMKRFSGLLEKGLLSEDDKGLVDAQAMAHEQTLAVEKARDELDQLNAAIAVEIPADGTIVELFVRDGSDVVTDQALAVLSVPSEVAIEAPVLPIHDVRVHVGTRARVHFDDAGPPMTLQVDYLLPQAERSTGATRIGILPGNDARQLRHGQRIRIDLLGDEVRALVVPSSSVVSRAGKTFCVKRSGDTWQVVEVKILDSDEAGRTFLSDGLKPGDEVIAEGAYGIIYRDFRELFTFED